MLRIKRLYKKEGSKFQKTNRFACFACGELFYENKLMGDICPICVEQMK